MPDQPYYDRDLSWLSFNYRVLMEAQDPELPLYERLKFLAIYSSNLDEFFRVRVASIRSILKLKKKKRKKMGIFGPRKLLQSIHAEVLRQQEDFGAVFRDDLLPGLAAHGIRLLTNVPEAESQQAFVSKFFTEQVLPFVHPVILMKGKIAHFLRDRALYLAVKMALRPQGMKQSPLEREQARPGKKKVFFAIVQIPTHYFGRFVELPQVDDGYDIMFLDDIVRYHLDEIFPGFDIEECGSIKLSRDADLQIEDEFSGDLVEKIQRNLSKRQVGAPARFLYDKNMSTELLNYLRQTFMLEEEDLIPGGRYHNFNDFFTFPNPLSPQLEVIPLPQLPHPAMDAEPSLFATLGQQEYVLHLPYQTYDYVLRFLNEAANDPQVTEIYTTQYRVASDSAIVRALINAARNGKKVRVFVEIKARFDEAVNLRSAMDMKAAGVEVTFSMPLLKVHAKAAMAIREEAGGPRAYAFLSTGNFNEKTARLYADHGLFTSDSRLCDELSEVFRYLHDHSYQPAPFRHLLVAQFNIRQGFYALIDREIAHARAGRAAYMCIKLNNLEDRGMIDKLYEANRAGVRIDLIVRSICCLRPGLPQLSEHITVTRIVDRYLEHARVFLFHDGGKNHLFMGSADWMDRNLNRRVEVVFPVYDAQIKAQLIHILQLQLSDNVKAVQLDADMENIRVLRQPGEPRIQAQLDTYSLIKTGKLGEDTSLFATKKGT
ncbi:MAG: polyphosphate kinase 1 [Bacteroidetes bacterium]|nr:MAG: polyphosphate kinase 1 [Bacteroidota bacterium]